jgi:hypothetical protein
MLGTDYRPEVLLVDSDILRANMAVIRNLLDERLNFLKLFNQASRCLSRCNLLYDFRFRFISAATSRL